MTSDNSKKLTRMQNFSVISRLMVICKKLEGGRALYEEGHTDYTIADEFGISHSQVASCRTEAIGLLSINNASKINMRVRVDSLEQRLADLEIKFSDWHKQWEAD